MTQSTIPFFYGSQPFSYSQPPSFCGPPTFAALLATRAKWARRQARRWQRTATFLLPEPGLVPPLCVLNPDFKPLMGPEKPEPKSLAGFIAKTSHHLSAVHDAHWPILKAAVPDNANHLLNRYLNLNADGIQRLALHCANKKMPTAAAKLAWASRLLKKPIPGKSLMGQLARVNCPAYWVKSLRVRINQKREHIFLRRGYVGHLKNHCVSQYSTVAYDLMRAKQQQWLENTLVLRQGDVPDAETKTLADITKGPAERLAKLYSFVNAMEQIAVQDGLSAVMLTLTLEPEWHPNPKYGKKSWNGATPDAAHRSLCRRWQSICRDLHGYNIGISGLRVVEAHQDGCPHWHIWLLHQPEHENRIMRTVSKYFPNKLKLSDPTQSPREQTQFFDTPEHLLHNTPRCPRYAKEGAQVDWVRIDRRISSGSSYVMKYLFKALEGQEKTHKLLKKEAGEPMPSRQELNAQHEQAYRASAYRWLWRMNACQLFGVAKCLTAWDELRRYTERPRYWRLRKLWYLARGSKKEGYLKDTRGDAKAFLLEAGGLAASSTPLARKSSGSKDVLTRGTRDAYNGYGEVVKRTVGIELVRRTPVERWVRQIHPKTGTLRLVRRREVMTVLLGSIKTRVERWVTQRLTPAIDALRIAAKAEKAAKAAKAAGKKPAT